MDAVGSAAGAGYRVIGIGNRFRRDDGAGPAVIAHLRAAGVPEGQLRVETGEGASLMDAWEGVPVVMVIDAMKSGREPGVVRRIDTGEESVPGGEFHYSTHAFSLAEAVELARVLGRLPPRLILYGIEGADFGPGEGLSPVVARAVESVAASVRAGLSGGEASV